MRTATFLVALAVSGIVAAAAHADPHSDYMLHCQGCHGPDGSGAAGAVPTFRGQIATFLRIPGGREYLIRVPGVSQSELSDARVAEVLNWIVGEFDAAQRPATAAPFSEKEVARYRRPPLANVEEVRAALLQTLSTAETP
jgi:mono/diheme cytochrome c family protein